MRYNYETTKKINYCKSLSSRSFQDYVSLHETILKQHQYTCPKKGDRGKSRTNTTYSSVIKIRMSLFGSLMFKCSGWQALSMSIVQSSLGRKTLIHHHEKGADGTERLKFRSMRLFSTII